MAISKEDKAIYANMFRNVGIALLIGLVICSIAGATNVPWLAVPIGGISAFIAGYAATSGESKFRLGIGATWGIITAIFVAIAVAVS